jgi:hypothetical protein
VQIYTLPDITPGGTPVNLGTVATNNSMPLSAIWVNITASGTSIRFGDANVGSARGQAITTAVPFNVAPRGDNPQRPYELNKMYVYGTSSDKISVTYGV